MKEVQNTQFCTATMLAALGRFSRRLAGNKGLRSLIAEIKKRPKISVPDDPARLDDHRQTAELTLRALDMIGGPKFRAKVFETAEMPNGVGDWKNALRPTVRAYRRVQEALKTTTDKKKILGLVGIRIPIA